MRILFIGDIVGRSGRAVVLRAPAAALARLAARLRRHQRRERGRRIRHHRGDLPGSDRCRRRCDHARQSRLGPEGGAGLHRAGAAPDPSDQLSPRDARARRRPDRDQDRRACAGGQRHGPHLHGPARRSVRGGRARAPRASARRDRGCRRHRHARRSHQREAGHGSFLRRPRQPSGRHPHPRADRRPSESCRAAPPSCRMSA